MLEPTAVVRGKGDQVKATLHRANAELRAKKASRVAEPMRTFDVATALDCKIDLLTRADAAARA